VDGGGRWQQMWHITLPGIKPTIFILLILSMGSILNGGNLELIRMIWTQSNSVTSTTLAYHIYSSGLLQNLYSGAAAMGLFCSLVGFALTWSVNALNKKVTGFGLW